MMTVVDNMSDYELGTVVDVLSMMQDDLNVTIGELLRILWREENRREIRDMTT